jgi:hypothetical protein
MTSRTRTDAHSPLNLVTEDYEYVWSYDSQQPGCLIEVVKTGWWQEISSNRANIHDQGQCDHCGAWLRYIAILKHTPTGKFLEVGETCLDNRFGRATADFHVLRRQAALDRKEQRILTAWNAYKAEHAHVDWDTLAASTNGFVINVLAKGRKYGNLSDRQLEAIQEAIVRDAQREERKAIEATIPTVPVPEGKGIVITGKLVSRKWKETDFGSVEKCLVVVETPEGQYKVWGSIPSSLYDTFKGTREVDVPGAAIGDTVTFTANVKRSDNDTSFGFYSRPRKASIVSKENQ